MYSINWNQFTHAISHAYIAACPENHDNDYYGADLDCSKNTVSSLYPHLELQFYSVTESDNGDSEDLWSTTTHGGYKNSEPTTAADLPTSSNFDPVLHRSQVGDSYSSVVEVKTPTPRLLKRTSFSGT